MKVLIQWSRADPRDWEAINLFPGSNAWDRLPKLPVPKKGQLGGQNNLRGYIYDIQVQGIVLGGMDHIYAEPIEDGVRVVGWNDDLDDFPVGKRWARVMDFLDVPSKNLPFTQYKTYFAEEDSTPRTDMHWPHNTSTGHPAVLRPWEEFVPPPEDQTLHGIWLSPELNGKHIRVRRAPNFNEWVA